MGALSPPPPLQLHLSPKLTTSSSSSLRVSTAAKSLIHHHQPISSSSSSSSSGRTHSHRSHLHSSIDYASLRPSFLINNPLISTNSKPNPTKLRATKKSPDEEGGGGEVGEAARASSDQTEKPLPPREDSNQSPSSSPEAAANYKEEGGSVAAAGTSGESWQGVLEEIKQIEWPEFGKVLGTTGVVLSVIAGSSLVLLTVNAVFAELSDRPFAGRGIQDFFG